jgi:recombination protein RecR
MNLLPKSVSRVIESFEKLPGVGPKTAQRLAFYMLHMPLEEVERFAEYLKVLKQQTLLCSVCKHVTESDPCPICKNPSRDHSVICVVEQPTDILAIEKTGIFHGVYHVLHGLIDPLNNIGPDEIYMDDLIKRVKNTAEPIQELIFALNSTMESEATIMYAKKQLSIRQLADPPQSDFKITRLAHGLPIGADIEYADEITLKRAMEGRREY